MQDRATLESDPSGLCLDGSVSSGPVAMPLFGATGFFFSENQG